MENREKADAGVLRVQMFGGFSMTWNDVQIIGGSKVRESQFAYLMQFLLHHRKEGAGRDELAEILFGEREVGDINHSLRSVLYNARKKLRGAGLPDVEYIRQENGTYYWTDEIPVAEDTEEFEELFRIAQETEEPDKKLDCLLRACYRYSGEFLPNQLSVIWVAQESMRFQNMFYACVEETATLLRIYEEWQQMKELGTYVSRIYPFANWEIITMEALVSMGCVAEARKLYDDTAESYMREMGLRPSKRMKEYLDKLGKTLSHRYAVLDAIQNDLSEDKGEQPGGYLCSWPIFQGIYQIIERIMERSGQSVFLMLCTVVDSKGNPMEEGATLEKLSERLEEAICCSVRHGDAVTKYGKGQYLVLLQGTTREDCQIIQKRINYKFIVGRQRTGIKYYVNSVICSKDTFG